MNKESVDNRQVNVNYSVLGLHFDAAVDCDWMLHIYDRGGYAEEFFDKENITPIELFCFDHPDWGIRMLYQKGKNEQRTDERVPHLIYRTLCNFDEILRETREWIAEMTKTNTDDERGSDLQGD